MSGRRGFPLVFVVIAGCEPFAGSPGNVDGGRSSLDGSIPASDGGEFLLTPGLGSKAFVQVVAGTSFCNWNQANNCPSAPLDREISHSCALRNDGRVYCWGASRTGRLGVVDADEQPQEVGKLRTPVRVDLGGLRARKLTAGADHTCALTGDGSVWCWGYNWNGQLGVAESKEGTVTQGKGVKPTKALDNVPNETVLDLEAGQGNTCLRTADNVYCFGKVNDGEGAFHRGGPVTTMSIGWKTTCGLEGPSNQQRVWCSGDNASQVVSSKVDVFVSNKTLASLADTASFIDVSVGYTFACARTVQTAYCWGNNGLGQLGGEFPTSLTVPPEQAKSSAAFAASTTGGASIGLLRSGARHVCWTSSGKVTCMGDNTYGQAASGIADVVDLALAATHTCAVTKDGMVYCWGSNAFGQLGRLPTDSFDPDSPNLGTKERPATGKAQRVTFPDE